MHYWPHGDNFSEPPETSDLVRRRPVGVAYWESRAFPRAEALFAFRQIWMRKTGKTVKNPTAPDDPRFSIFREPSIGRRRGNTEFEKD